MAKPKVVRYEWKPGRSFQTPAIEAHNTIELLRKRDGACTPGALVDWSREPGRGCHDDFQWDDTEAAELYRHGQARQILNHLVVVYKADTAGAQEKPGRAYIAMRTLGQPAIESEGDDVGTSGYVDSNTVLSDPTLRRRYIVSALREVAAWRRKHADIVELSRLFEAIDPVLVEYEVAPRAEMATAGSAA